MFTGYLLFTALVKAGRRNLLSKAAILCCLVLIASAEVVFPRLCQLPFGLGRGAIGAGFMLWGFWIRDYKLLENRSGRYYILTNLMALVLFLGALRMGSDGSALVRSYYGPYGAASVLATFIGGAAGVWLLFSFCMIVEKLPAPPVKKLLSYTGRNVMSFPVVQLRDKIFSKKINRLKLSIKSEFHKNYQSQNVWAKVEGTKYKDSCFAFVCHYDHLGKIGSVHFPGANDNASAVAVLLDLAKYYAKNPAEHSVVFMFVTGEEIGLVGSTFAAENPLVDLSKMKFLFNLDMVGTGSTGVAVINGKKEPEAGKLLQTINEENHWFSKVVLGEESCNSDHCPFVQKGVPAHFLFTYGCEYNEYHTVYDDGVELSFTKHIDFCNLLKEFIKRY
jgi:hypothetical protein